MNDAVQIEEKFQRLRLATLRAIAELHNNLLRPIRPIEIYNTRGLRLEKSQDVDEVLIACWKDTMLRRNPSGEYDLTAKGRDFLQSAASVALPAPASIPIVKSLPELVPFTPKHPGRKPGSKNKPKDPNKAPGPVKTITPAEAQERLANMPPEQEIHRVENLTRQLREVHAEKGVQVQTDYVASTVAYLLRRADEHDIAAAKFRTLATNLKEAMDEET